MRLGQPKSNDRRAEEAPRAIVDFFARPESQIKMAELNLATAKRALELLEQERDFRAKLDNCPFRISNVYEFMRARQRIVQCQARLDKLKQLNDE